MSETLEIVQPEVTVKPYTFRLLGAPDIFLMSKIISQIGIKEFKACFESDSIQNLIHDMMEKGKEDGKTDNSNVVSVGVGVAVEIAGVILGNLPKCENDIYQMLAQTSNLSVDEIKAPGNAVMFLEMVIDFIKKEEFRDFIKVVSKLFK
jgi:hypothetical protein